MLDTYKHTIKILDGSDQEVELRRLTVRHGLKLQGKTEDEIVEILLDLVAPGVLDIISVESLADLSAAIMEKEKDFFVQMAAAATKAKEAKKKKRKK